MTPDHRHPASEEPIKRPPRYKVLSHGRYVAIEAQRYDQLIAAEAKLSRLRADINAILEQPITEGTRSLLTIAIKESKP